MCDFVQKVKEKKKMLKLRQSARRQWSHVKNVYSSKSWISELAIKMYLKKYNAICVKQRHVGINFLPDAEIK